MSGPVVQLRRDPFARITLMRERVKNGSCYYCGNSGRAWIYYWVNDSGRVVSDLIGRMPKDAFCSVGCWEDYN